MESLIEKIRQEIERNGGLIKTSQLYELSISYRKIQSLVKNGVLERVKNGYYSMGFSNKSEETMICGLFPDGVLCLESALFYQGYLDIRPACWHIAVDKDTSKSRFHMSYPPVQPYYVEQEVLKMGVEEIELGEGKISIYNKERLICDCLKFEEKLSREVMQQALRQYIAEPEKDIQKLLDYAKARKVTQKVQNRIGVWL